MAQGGPFIEDVKNQISLSCEPALLKIMTMLHGFMNQGQIRKMDPMGIFMNFSVMCHYTFIQLPFDRRSNLVEMPNDESEYFEAKANFIIDMTVKALLK